MLESVLENFSNNCLQKRIRGHNSHRYILGKKVGEFSDVDPFDLDEEIEEEMDLYEEIQIW